MDNLLLSESSYTLQSSTHPNRCHLSINTLCLTGSFSAAHITLLQTITNLMTTKPLVIVTALDFSKTFDTVKHNVLLSKMAMLNIPDPIYNWLVDFFTGRKVNTVRYFKG